MVQLRCLCLALRRDGKVAEIEVRALCISPADQFMLLSVQKCERLRARSVRVDTHLSLLKQATLLL